jgi:hypothetical protein
VGNQTLVFHIKFGGKSPALRVAAKRVSAIIFDTIENEIFAMHGLNNAKNNLKTIL